jgi:hypothetical protein
MRTITKGELCRILKLYSVRSGRMYYSRLNSKYFTDEVLQKLKINRETYSKIKVFDIVQTQTILDLFKIGENQVH